MSDRQNNILLSVLAMFGVVVLVWAGVCIKGIREEQKIQRRGVSVQLQVTTDNLTAEQRMLEDDAAPPPEYTNDTASDKSTLPL